MKTTFTAEELAAMRAADEEIERDFRLTEEERALSDAMDDAMRSKSAARKHRYYLKHREECKKKMRSYYYANLEKRRAYGREYMRKKRATQ